MFGCEPFLLPSKITTRLSNLVSLPTSSSSSHRAYNQATQNGGTGTSISGKINNDVKSTDDIVFVSTDSSDSVDPVKDISRLISRCSKTHTLTVHDSKLRDPSGHIVNDMRTANFLMAGSHSKRRSVKTKGKTKLPANGAKVYGNENLPRISRHLDPLKNYLFHQFIGNGSIAGSVTGTFGEITHTLSQMDQVSSFTVLYDQYCIRRVEIWFEAQNTEITGGNGFQPSLWVAYDPDGSTITSVADLRQYSDVVQCLGTQSQYVCYTPSVAVATYGGAFTKYSFEQNQWCDIANTDITHYSCVYALEAASGSGYFNYTVVARLWVEFRGVR